MANNEQRRKDAMRTLKRELRHRARAERLKPLDVVITISATLLFIGGGIYLLTTTDGADSGKAADESTAPVEPVALTATPVSSEKTPMKRSFLLPETMDCDHPNDGEASKDIDKPATDNIPATGTATIALKTNQGDIPVELDRAISPCGVNTIGHMAESDYFNGTVCHRITDGGLNVLQCGDPTDTSTGGPGFKLAGERPVKDSSLDQDTPLVYPKGSIAMTDPSDPDANGSQFFLNWADSQLPPQYTVLSSMTDGGTKAVADIAKNDIEGDDISGGKPAKEVRTRKVEVRWLTQLTD